MSPPRCCIVLLALCACAPPDPPAPAASDVYVEAGACRDCHLEIWNTYVQTGMGRSFYRPAPENVVEPWDGAPYYHQASGRYYRMTRRDGRFFQQRYELGPVDQKINVIEREIDFVMGSGNHVRTYLHQKQNGEIVELPLAWYAENGGQWAMNPGYDRRDHYGFQRLIAFDCMFCHNGYPELPAGADMAGRPAAYPGRIPEGIDCQRCHGPGLAHLEALQRDAGPEEVAASIVNPARLPLERQMEVCYQCHLETTSRPLPNVLHRFGRGVFSFRPGEPLADYVMHFDHAPGAGFDDKFEINHSAYRLRQSACFRGSGGELQCTTCHDPHGAPMTRPMAQTCARCHEGVAALAGHPSGEDCAACHMPKRRTDDVVRAVMTDHRIQRPGSSEADLLRPKREQAPAAVAYRGEVAAYDPIAPPPEYLALAQIAQDANRSKGIRRLSALDLEPELLYELASAQERAGDLDAAIDGFLQVVEARPELALARRRLGAALRAAGSLVRAEQELLVAMQQAPGDARVRKELGLIYIDMGEPARAALAFRAAIERDPELPENHNNLGGALVQLGQLAEGESAFREVIRLQPDLAEANLGLGNVIAAGGELRGAMPYWRRAIESDPQLAMARLNYGIGLVEQGQTKEAKAHLEAAAAGQDRQVREAAEKALRELRSPTR